MWGKREKGEGNRGMKDEIFGIREWRLRRPRIFYHQGTKMDGKRESGMGDGKWWMGYAALCCPHFGRASHREEHSVSATFAHTTHENNLLFQPLHDGYSYASSEPKCYNILIEY
jgi:hypothetical protein